MTRECKFDELAIGCEFQFPSIAYTFMKVGERVCRVVGKHCFIDPDDFHLDHDELQLGIIY